MPVTLLVHAAGGSEGEPAAFRGRRGGRELARQQTAGDRVVGDDANAFLPAEREHLSLDLAEQQAIAGPGRGEASQPERLAPADGADQLLGEEVRGAYVPDLSGVDEVVQGAQGLVDRRRRVVSVQLVQVNVVGLEATQRGVEGGHDVLPGIAGVKGRRSGRYEAFGRHDETVPLTVQPPAQ